MYSDSNTILTGLIGNPVQGSKSPTIHSISFKKNEINASYLAFEVGENDLKSALDGLGVIGAAGINVTIPYKEKVIPYLDEIRGEAKTMMSVNTIKFENGRLIGYNTDGAGFLKSLKDKNIDTEDKNIIIIGAGGAARGISHAIAANRTKGRLIIANRTIEKATALSNELSDIYPDGNSSFSSVEIELSDREIGKFNPDIVINTTSIGMQPNVKDIPLKKEVFDACGKNTVFADIVYKPHNTEFLRLAASYGFEVVHGIDMLINQAILSEEIWLDCNIDIKNTRKEIIKTIGIGD